MSTNSPIRGEEETSERMMFGCGWTRATPNPRIVRINCDASWCARTGMGRMSVIARNFDENVIGGFNRRRRDDGSNGHSCRNKASGGKGVVRRGNQIRLEGGDWTNKGWCPTLADYSSTREHLSMCITT